MTATTGNSRWQVSLRVLLLVWLGLTVGGVIGRRVYLHYFPPPIEMKHLCAIDGLDQLTQMHLQNLLIRESVTGVIQGSRTYSCQVDANEYERILRMLKQAENSSRPTVKIRDDGSPIESLVLVGDERNSFDYTPEQPLAEILADPTTELAKMLQAITDHEGDPTLHERTPIIHRVTGHRRFYLQPDGTFGLGYEVTVERVNRLPDPTATSSHNYQIYDNFREVASLGGTTWTDEKRVSAP